MAGILRGTWSVVRTAAGAALALVLGLAAALVAAVVMLASSDGRLPLPERVTDAVEAQLASRVPGARIDLGTISVGLDGMVPRLWLENVSLADPAGTEIGGLARVGVAFDPGAALKGRIAPRILRVSGARLLVERDDAGNFSLSFGGGGGGFTAESPGALLDAVEAVLDRPPLARVERVELTGTEIALRDERADRLWRVTNGRAALVRGEAGLSLTVDAGLDNGTETRAEARLSIETDAADSGARLSVRLDRIAAADIAAQSPALAVLGLLDAPISGELATVIAPDGAVERLTGALGIEAGLLTPGAGVEPLPFDGARAEFAYDPEVQKITLDRLLVEAPEGAADLSGHAYLSEIGPNGLPNALALQLDLAHVRLGTEALFPEPVEAANGSADLRLRLSPFSVEVGTWSLPLGEDILRDTLTGTARAEAGLDGWSADLSLTAGRMPAERLRRFWPIPVARKPRAFFLERVTEGTAIDPTVVLRLRPGMEKPRAEVSFAFEGAETRAVPFLPPITSGAGFATLSDNRFSLRLDTGRMTPEGRAPVSLGGTTFTIPDVRQKPAEGRIEVASDGPLPSVLAIIDAPPLSVMQRAKRTPDLAEGRLVATTTITLPLKKGITPDDVRFKTVGTLTDLASDTIVPGRRIEADRMTVAVEPERIRVSGGARFEGIPFDGAWTQTLRGAGAGRGSVKGTARVTPEGLARLGIALPEGLISGAGRAAIDIALAPGAPPDLTATSNLAGVGLSVDAVNWSKRPDASGNFEIEASLGSPPTVKRMQLEAPGLFARGHVDLSSSGFEALRLDRVVVGDWFDGAVTIASQGGGRPVAISVPSGSVDLRRAQLGGSGGGGGGERGLISLRLDRIELTDTIALRSARVDIAPGRAMSGSFAGRINGGAAIDGQLVGTSRGTAIRVGTTDAGALLRDAGLIDRVQGGQMDLVLQPTGEDGTYEGSVRVVNPLLRDAPAIAELLSAISVVGLLEQLDTRGIPFEEVSAEFRASPRAITLYRSSAVGASLGLSMDGTYDMVGKRMDMQGVVSPIYLLNRVGSIFTRRGEGLFGVNFTLRGPVSRPQVGVNPLSILTPGMFREIFRRPAPTRPAQ